MRNSITLFDDQYDLYKSMKSKRLLIAFVEYMFEDIEPEWLNKIEQSVFNSLRKRMENSMRKHDWNSNWWKKSKWWWRPTNPSLELNTENKSKTTHQQVKQQVKNNEEEDNISKDILLEEEEEVKEKEKNSQPPQPSPLTVEQSARINYMNGMRNVEVRWKQLINRWNKITGKEEFMNEEIKKSIYNLQWIPLETFEDRVKKYQFICDKIKETKSEKLFYYPIWEWDLLKFISKINLFYWEDSIIISKIAHKDGVIKDRAVRLLTTQQSEQKSDYSNLLDSLY